MWKAVIIIVLRLAIDIASSFNIRHKQFLIPAEAKHK